jgi:hypothetical protein
MGCRVSFCIGGGCVPTDTSVEDWVEAFGYTYNPSDPLASTYTDLIASAPAQFRSGGLYAAWPALAEACMRTRAMLFCNQSPGDAGSTNSQSVASNTLTATSIAGEATNEIPVPGLSEILGPILQVFQEHAEAETKQATALSTLGPQITEAIRRADASVLDGTSTPDQAIAFLQQTMAAAQQSWGGLVKNCNAFCWYNAILNLLVQISEYYYQLTVSQAAIEQSNEENIVPSGANIPANATTTVSGTPSTAVTAAATALNQTIGGIKASTLAIGAVLLLAAVALFSRSRN